MLRFSSKPEIMKYIKFIALTLILVVLAVVALSMKGDSNTEDDAPQIIEGNPTDATMDFVSAWANARRDPATDPYQKGLLDYYAVSPTLRTALEEAQETFSVSGIDPVLCQSSVPDRIRTKTVAITDNTAQIMILAKGELTVPIGIAKLGPVDGEWKILEIDCDVSERGPEIGEYNFEKNGRLLKDSVKPPLDPNNWYLIYERDGVMGYTAQITMTDTTVCTKLDGTEITCGGEEFYETMNVDIKGNMSETGVEVVAITIIE